MTSPSAFGSVGDAYANFHLRTTPADKDLKNFLKDASDDASKFMKKAGDNAGADFSKGLADGIESTLKKNVSDVLRTVERETIKVKVKTDVDVDHDSVQRSAKSVASTITGALTNAFKSSGKSVGSGGSLIGGGIVTLLRGLGSSVGNVGSAGPLAPIIGGGLIIAIGGLVGAIAALINVLGPLINSLLLLPGLLAVVVAAFGPLLVVFSGFGEAVSAFVSGDADAIAEVMKSLGPNTAEFAKQVAAVIPWLSELKKATQESFFGVVKDAGFADTIEALKGIIGPGFAKVVTQAGTFFATFLATARDPAVTHFLEMLFTSAAGFWDAIGPGINQFVLGLAELGIGTLPTIDAMLKDIGGMLTRFGIWLQDLDEDGRLNSLLEKLNTAWENLKTLAASGWNLIRVIIGNAGEDGMAQTFFDSLVFVINLLTEFFESDIGRKSIEGMVFAAILLVAALGLAIVAFSLIFFLLERIGALFEWLIGLAVTFYQWLFRIIGLGNLLPVPGNGQAVAGGLFPRTAEGGIFDGAQVRLIGEAGPEAVIPLTDANRARDLINQSGLNSVMGGDGGDVNIGQGAVVINNYGGVPNREQTAQMAAGAMDGISSSLAKRNTRQAIRTMGAAA